MDLRNGVDASGRKPTGKGVYQFVDKYGANVDGYRWVVVTIAQHSLPIVEWFSTNVDWIYGMCSPIYDRNDWSPSGDVYVGGTTGLAIWAVTLLGILAGGALLVYNTSALAQ